VLSQIIQILVRRPFVRSDTQQIDAELYRRTLWALCRCRHKAYYADVRIMPTCVGNPGCGAGIAAMGSA